MSIPLTGILLIPLGLLLAVMPWRYCLIGLMCFAMLSPAAVVNVGSFGLQPGYYLGLLLIGRAVLQILQNRLTLNAFVGGRMLPLVCFFALVLAVLFIALGFFQGQVETLPGSAGFKSGMTRPFHMARENFTQLAYLFINTCLIYAIGHISAMQKPRPLLIACDRAVMIGLFFSAAVCAWQFSSLYAGVPFAPDFFYSNAGYSRADSQSMIGLFRINGPFEEPSTLGYTFSGYLLYAWARHRAQPTALALGAIAACVLCMLVSTSTTAFFGLFLFGAVALYDVTSGRGMARNRKPRSQAYGVVAGMIGLVITASVFVVIANWPAIRLILNATLFNKSSGTSFHERSYADYLAVQIFSQTYGAGIGLGSHKANSLLLTLLSNTGILGLGLFAAFAFARFAWRPNRHGQPMVLTNLAVRPLKYGLFGVVMVHVISNPNLSTLTLWLYLGMLLAMEASAQTWRGMAVADNPPPGPVVAPPPLLGEGRARSHASV